MVESLGRMEPGEGTLMEVGRGRILPRYIPGMPASTCSGHLSIWAGRRDGEDFKGTTWVVIVVTDGIFQVAYEWHNRRTGIGRRVRVRKTYLIIYQSIALKLWMCSRIVIKRAEKYYINTRLRRHCYDCLR